jgi:hypothetical protein
MSPDRLMEFFNVFIFYDWIGWKEIFKTYGMWKPKIQIKAGELHNA